MAIVVNLDVMMAKRKMTLSPAVGKGRHHLGQSVDSEKQQGQGGAFFHTGSHLCRIGLSAR